jgi:hypothetical protein
MANARGFFKGESKRVNWEPFNRKYKEEAKRLEEYAAEDAKMLGRISGPVQERIDALKKSILSDSEISADVKKLLFGDLELKKKEQQDVQ